MNTINVYPTDKNRIWTGEVVEQPDTSPIKGVTDTPPELNGTEVAERRGKVWHVLPGYPDHSERDITILRAATEVTMRQARLALSKQGLLSSVQESLDNLTPGKDKEEVLIEWQYSSTVKRMHNWVLSMQVTLGLTDEQLDDLFTLAKTL